MKNNWCTLHVVLWYFFYVELSCVRIKIYLSREIGVFKYCWEPRWELRLRTLTEAFPVQPSCELVWPWSESRTFQTIELISCTKIVILKKHFTTFYFVIIIDFQKLQKSELCTPSTQIPPDVLSLAERKYNFHNSFKFSLRKKVSFFSLRDISIHFHSRLSTILGLEKFHAHFSNWVRWFSVTFSQLPLKALIPSPRFFLVRS